ncbi:hypothetical protein ACQKGO_17250 [Corallococcus interemptor]|uniref:hypothetical protein n=1 Tax=Corallococcus interemptor TaxID=2316720 RepID=UPI003D095774
MRLPLVLTAFLGLASLQSSCRSNTPGPSSPQDSGVVVGAGITDAGVTPDAGPPPDSTSRAS